MLLSKIFVAAFLLHILYWIVASLPHSSKMAPAMRINDPKAVPVVGPSASFICVADQYPFQQKLQHQLVAIGANPTREDNFRLAGVQWISDVRTALQL